MKEKILFIFENTTPCIEYLMYLNQVLKYSRHQVQVSTSTFQILERQVQVQVLASSSTSTSTSTQVEVLYLTQP